MLCKDKSDLIFYQLHSHNTVDGHDGGDSSNAGGDGYDGGD